MMPEKNEKPTIRLEDLLAMKRAERPPEEFWDSFQREFHVRQRAAAVEPKRWWFVLPRVFAGMAHYQMPMGAAAVLAVTFLSFREYSEPGFEVAYTAAPIVAAVESAPAVEVPEVMIEAQPVVQNEQIEMPVASDSIEATESVLGTHSVAISPLMVWAGVSGVSAAFVAQSPSARSIAANLAVIEAENGNVSALLGGPKFDLRSAVVAGDPLADVSLSDDSRNRLFAYQPNASKVGANSAEGEGADIQSRLANRLNDDLLYDSVRRVTAGGDRLTLKF